MSHISKAQVRKSHPRIDAILLSQPEADRPEIWDILLDPSRSERKLSEAFTAAGHPIGKTAINDFRTMRRGSRYVPPAAEKGSSDCE